MDMVKAFEIDRERMTEKIYHRLMCIGVYSDELESYEMRNSVKLYTSFKNMNKNSYGALLNFRQRLVECMKYYTAGKSIKLAGEIISCINDFLGKYEPLLS